MNTRFNPWRIAMIAVAVTWAGGALDAQRDWQPTTYAPGDLNLNGTYDSRDLDLFKQTLRGEWRGATKAQLDVDGNGRIDDADYDALEVLVAEAERKREKVETGSRASSGQERVRFLRGDVDADGNVDLADAILMQEIVMGINQPIGPKESADVNSDGRIDISDLIALVEKLYPRERPNLDAPDDRTDREQDPKSKPQPAPDPVRTDRERERRRRG